MRIIRQSRTLHIALCLMICAMCTWADDATGWITDGMHPNVQYRFKCTREALTIQWKNSYPGAVTLKVRVRGDNYDGDEQVTIPAGGIAASSPETLYCNPDAFEISERRFAMTPPQRAAATTEQADKPKEPVPTPTVAPWIPPVKSAELAPQKLELVHAGMKGERVLQFLGTPASKVEIPEENTLLEIYRYAVSSGRGGTIRLSNGVVTEVFISPP